MKKLILIIIICAFEYPVQAQKFIVDEVYNLKKIGISEKTGIVDINSGLEIKLNMDSITVALAKKVNIDSKLTGELTKLNKLLENEVILLQKLQTKLSPKADHTAQLVALGEISQLMVDFMNIVMAEPELREETNRLIDAFQALHPKDQAVYNDQQEVYLIRNFSFKSKKIVEELKAGDLNKVVVALRAYISGKDGIRRKVHITNFDNYVDGEFYEVPRWVTNFSSQDIAQFNAAAKLTATANELINTNKKNIWAILESKLQSAGKVKALLSEIKTARTNRATYFVAEVALADQFLNQMEAEVSGIITAIENMRKLQNGNVLELYNTLLQEFTNLGKALGPNATAFETKLTSNLKANAHLTTLKANLLSCIQAIDEDINLIKGIQVAVTDILKPAANTAAAAAEVSGESFKRSLSELPDIGTIDLKKTGKRQNGDELEISITYQIPEAKNQEEIVFDYKKLTLQQVNFYSVASVSAVLVNPFDKSASVMIPNKFQFAPAASLLMKFGSRTSTTWNAISPGLGLTFPTPDLDLDGSPDFSFGGTATLFKDVLSFGLSYNTKTDSPFWFIGFSLPFTIIGGATNRPSTSQ